MTIAKNQVECGYCGEIIESKHRHDFRTCGCGLTSVDGGKEYLRRVGNLWHELSTYTPEPVEVAS